MPKPLVEFANKPMIMHQIEALAAVGVTDVVLAVNYRPEIMESVLKEVSFKQKSHNGPRVLHTFDRYLLTSPAFLSCIVRREAWC